MPARVVAAIVCAVLVWASGYNAQYADGWLAAIVCAVYAHALFGFVTRR